MSQFDIPNHLLDSVLIGCIREDTQALLGFCSGELTRFLAKRASISSLRLGPMSLNNGMDSQLCNTPTHSKLVLCPELQINTSAIHL